MQQHRYHLWLLEKLLPLRKAKEAQAAVNREKGKTREQYFVQYLLDSV